MAGTAIVLSGGGARGDFELGAVQFLYSLNIRPDILCGTSVGAVNAAKLAEGEGLPTQGLQGLSKIWHDLRQDGDMFEPEAWLDTIPPYLVDAVKQGRLDTLAPPSHALYDPRQPVPAFLQEVVNGISNFTNDAAWMASTGKGILESLVKVFSHKSIFNLEPIRRLINGNAAAGIAPSFSPGLVASWSNNGQRKLRLATVSLESGDLRYVDETGRLLEADAVTPVLRLQAGPLPPVCAAIQDKVQQIKAEIADLQNDMRADPTRKYSQAGRIAPLRNRQFQLERQLGQCIRDHATMAPVQVSISSGIIASSSIPSIFLAQRLADGDWYVDGGIRTIHPVAAALSLGADRVFIISASSPELERSSSFDSKNILEIAMRSVAEIAINQIGWSETQPTFGFGNRQITVIQPSIDIHDAMTIDPGLIRINASYGFMRAADVMAGVAADSQRSRDVDELIMLRTRQWQQECLLMGKGMPGVRPAGDYPPDPAMYQQVLETASRVRTMVQQRQQAGFPLPSRADRWGVTWEAHPWSSNTAAPLVAVSPQADELVVMGMAIESQQGEPRGRVMTARWSPNSGGWQAWEPVHFGWGAANSMVTAAVYNGEVHAFYVNGDGWVMRSIRNAQGTWGIWWPVGNSNAPNLQGVPGAPVHAAAVQNTQTSTLELHVCYTNRQGRILTATWDGVGWSGHAGVSQGTTKAGGHVTLVRRQNGLLHAFMVADTALHVQSNVWAPATGWQGWNAIAVSGATALPGSPVMGVSRRNDQVDLFWADELGRTMSAAFEPARGWVVIGNIQNGRTLPGGYVTAVSRALDLLDIFMVGTDRMLYRAQWDPASGWQGWTPMNSASVIGAAVWPASRAAGNIDVFFGSPDAGSQPPLRTATLAFDVPRGWLGPFVPNGSMWALDPTAALRGSA